MNTVYTHPVLARVFSLPIFSIMLLTLMSSMHEKFRIFEYADQQTLEHFLRYVVLVVFIALPVLGLEFIWNYSKGYKLLRKELLFGLPISSCFVCMFFIGLSIVVYTLYDTPRNVYSGQRIIPI